MLFVLGLFYFGCKKYPDDKGINLTQAKKRIYGEWKLNRILLNGSDITQQMDDSISNRNFSDVILGIYGDEYKDYSVVVFLNDTRKDRFDGGGHYFIKNEDFRIALGDYQVTVGNLPKDSIFIRQMSGIYKILRLQKHNFNLQFIKTGMVYEYTK